MAEIEIPRKKWLCVCEGGTVRSVGLALVLKMQLGQDALAGSWRWNDLGVLCEWADRIAIMQTEFLERIPEPFRGKVLVADVGPDRFGNPFHPELQELIREIVQDWVDLGMVSGTAAPPVAKEDPNAYHRGVVKELVDKGEMPPSALESFEPTKGGLLKFDLACGQACAPGFEGVDSSPLPGVKHVVDLLEFPWPWDSNSVTEVRCSHFIEHIDMGVWVEPAPAVPGEMPALPGQFSVRPIKGRKCTDLLVRFFQELHRVLVPGRTAEIIWPALQSIRAFQDPSHRRFIPLQTMLYLTKWRREKNLDHGVLETDCLFELVMHKYEYAEGVDPRRLPTGWEGRQISEWNFVNDYIAILRKPE